MNGDINGEEGTNAEKPSQSKLFEDMENPEELKKMAEEVSNIFEAKRNEDLKKVKKFFQLYKFSSKGLDIFIKCLVDYIKKSIREISYKSNNPKILIQEIINFKKKMNSLVEECFENIFQEEIITSFRATDSGFYSINLLEYLDIYMKKEFQGKSDEEIDNILNDAIGLYKYLGRPILFQKEAYKRMAYRLLKQESLSLNLEKKLIDKLKLKLL